MKATKDQSSTLKGILLLRLLCFLFLNALVNFLSMHLHSLRRIDPDSHLVSVHSDHGDGDLRPNHQRLASLPCEYEQETTP
jgi:hypothetical protein